MFLIAIQLLINAVFYVIIRKETYIGNMDIDVKDSKEAEDALWEETGFSRSRCRAVLKNNNNDFDKALEVLNALKNNRIEVLWDKILSYFIGERGRRCCVYDGEKELMAFPTFLPMLFLMFVNVPSWLVAVVLLLIFMFDMDLRTEKVSSNNEKNDGTVVISNENSQSPDIAINQAVVDSDGYAEFVVE